MTVAKKKNVSFPTDFKAMQQEENILWLLLRKTPKQMLDAMDISNINSRRSEMVTAWKNS